MGILVILICVLSTAVVIGGSLDKTKIEGTYVLHEKPDPAYWEFLLEIGVSKEKVERMKRGELKITVKRDEKFYTFTFDMGGIFRKWVLEPEKEVEDVFFNGRKSRLVLKVDGNKLVFDQSFPDYKIKAVAIFKKEGLDLTVAAKGTFKAHVVVERVL